MVRFLATLVVLAACCAGAMAQTAKVVELKAEDAALAKRLYEQQALIEKQIADLKAKILKDYLKQKNGCNNVVCNSPTFLAAFIDGFEYSDDFRFVVPVQPKYAIGGYLGCGNLTYSCCNTTSPAIIGGGTVTMPSYIGRGLTYSSPTVAY